MPKWVCLERNLFVHYTLRDGRSGKDKGAFIVDAAPLLPQPPSSAGRGAPPPADTDVAAPAPPRGGRCAGAAGALRRTARRVGTETDQLQAQASARQPLRTVACEPSWVWCCARARARRPAPIWYIHCRTPRVLQPPVLCSRSGTTKWKSSQTRPAERATSQRTLVLDHPQIS